MEAIVYTGKNYNKKYVGKVIQDGLNKITLAIILKDGSTTIRSFSKSKNLVKII